MNLRIILLFVMGSCLSAFSVEEISDPIKDFLNLPIEDRHTNASEVVEIQKVMIDLDLDGTPELLLGHHKMWAGDNHGIYFAIYKKLASGGFNRLTAPTQDIRLMFRDGNANASFVFVGRVDELNDTGLLVAEPEIGGADLKTGIIERRLFVSISSGSVKVVELPGWNLKDLRERRLYEKYFGHKGKQGGFSLESISVDELKKRGYVIPDWKVLPTSQSTPKPEAPPPPSSPVQDQPIKPAMAAVPVPSPISSNQETEMPRTNRWQIWVIVMVVISGLLFALFRRIQSRR